MKLDKGRAGAAGDPQALATQWFSQPLFAGLDLAASSGTFPGICADQQPVTCCSHVSCKAYAQVEKQPLNYCCQVTAHNQYLVLVLVLVLVLSVQRLPLRLQAELCWPVITVSQAGCASINQLCTDSPTLTAPHDIWTRCSALPASVALWHPELHQAASITKPRW